MLEEKRSIIFFDGLCHLCDGFIQILIKVDQGKVLFYSPLQGELSKSLSLVEKTSDVEGAYSTIVFLHNGVLYYKSEAVIRALSAIATWTKVLVLLLWIPNFIRDFVYDLVARNRYTVFGKRAACRIPTAEERLRFLP
jgi:predicted DCC family thiol-disulfide oxidoreductase YuxK